MPRGRRIQAGFYLVALGFAGLLGRVGYLQASGQTGPANGDRIFARDQKLPAQRGPILARDGTALAVSLDEYTIAANPRAYTAEEKDRLCEILARVTGEDRRGMRAALEKTTRPDGAPNFYVRLARGVSDTAHKELRTLMGPQPDESRSQRSARRAFWGNVSIEATPRRHYPMGEFAPQLIGFTTGEGEGVDGMERAWDAHLAGEDGLRESLVDARGNVVAGTVRTWREPVNGHTLVTTIDPQIQARADQAMREIHEKFRPNFASAVVIKVDTGEIIAASNAPGFNLNARPADMVELATNRAFSYAYEPGSTWKIVTAAAAVDTVPNWSSKRFYVNGITPAGKHMIRDWQYWSGRVQPGQRSLSDGIRDSSNVVMWHFTQQMPRPTLLQYAKRFGIGEKPSNLEGFNVHPGYLPSRDPENWPQVQLANFAFGQGLMLTPLQLAQIGAVVANDGVMMKPMLLREVRDGRGQVMQKFEPQVERQVISRETAREVAIMLRRVVSEGTARRYIFVPGYPSAGKTGSAQKADGPRGYRGRKFISSFVGYVPYDKPRYAVAIMADEPRASHWGSETCGPAFTAIAEEAMLAMRLEEGSSAPRPDPALMVRTP